MNSFLPDKIRQTLLLLKERMVKSAAALTDFYVMPCGYKTDNRLPDIKNFKPFRPDERWGSEYDSHCRFYSKVRVDKKNTYFSLKTGREGLWDASNPQFMIYLDGVPVQGMDTNHTEVLLPEIKEYEIYLYAYSGTEGRPAEFLPSLVTYDEDMRKLYYDIKIPYDAAMLMDSESSEYIGIMQRLDEAVRMLDFRVRGAEGESVGKADKYLEKEFYGKDCGKSKSAVIGIGHTHIDVAWLWTLAQTREKVQRSFGTALNLMKQYPEYKFMSSQAQLYKYLKEECPEMYAEIREMVKAHRWEVEGAMWVEADCNLTSGESLVRQLLYGKRFFAEEFGVDCKILWLPDVFGYSAALPQILVKSGVDAFVTSKISWNETNTMPCDTFMWQGIDGTKIFSHFLTAQTKVKGKKPSNFTTYVGNVTAAQVMGTWERYHQKDISNEVLLTYGYGDGGGGPTAEMIETGKRLERGIPGCPAFKFGTATEFIEKLRKTCGKSEELPEWVGELYLEFHRGTYTSMAKNKRANRKSEYLYQTAEFASLFSEKAAGGKYDAARLHNGWETILLNQFHDIIPGSSIKQVYEDSDRQYAQIEKNGREIVEEAICKISSEVDSDGGVFVFNPLPFENSGIVELDGKKVYAENIPPHGYKVTAVKEACSVKVTENTIENRFFRVRFSGADIKSIYDKVNRRELIRRGEKANVIRCYEDYPRDYDAWELSSYYVDKSWDMNDIESIEPFTDGAAAGLKITRRFLDSVMIQKICMYDEIARIDFDTFVDWKQDHILVKALFPFDIHAEKATFDIQFGSVERATHRNTSWDKAKFEVCAHKFADISEEDYGVSLMNDCKYGYSVHGSDMSITLLKSATYPNPDADKCEHRFVYSIYPHRGNHRSGGTYAAAYNLNVPMYAMALGKQSGKLPCEYSFVSADCENVIIDTVKKTEDGSGTLIRMFEAHNKRSRTHIKLGFAANKVFLADLSENKLSELKIKDGEVEIEIKPFEIITLIAE